MRPLALDLATLMGFAIRQGGTLLIGTHDLSARRGEGAGMCYIRFRKWLSELYRTVPFGIIYYEQVIGISPRAGQAAQHQRYGGFLAIMQSWCEENGVPYSGVPVNRIKSFAGCKGNCKKEEMITVAKELLKTERNLIIESKRANVEIDTIDDNMADAYHLLLLVEDDRFDP